jgi:hypothetical protein
MVTPFSADNRPVSALIQLVVDMGWHSCLDYANVCSADSSRFYERDPTSQMSHIAHLSGWETKWTEQLPGLSFEDPHG